MVACLNIQDVLTMCRDDRIFIFLCDRTTKSADASRLDAVIKYFICLDLNGMDDFSHIR